MSVLPVSLDGLQLVVVLRRMGLAGRRRSRTGRRLRVRSAWVRPAIVGVGVLGRVGLPGRVGGRGGGGAPGRVIGVRGKGPRRLLLALSAALLRIEHVGFVTHGVAISFPWGERRVSVARRASGSPAQSAANIAAVTPVATAHASTPKRTSVISSTAPVIASPSARRPAIASRLESVT